jgi:hypothetical protein
MMMDIYINACYNVLHGLPCTIAENLHTLLNNLGRGN